MADTGWVIAGTGASDSTIGAEAWVNTSNITADDSTLSDGTPTKNEQMEYLLATNFGLSVPAGATIDGIEIRCQAVEKVASLEISLLNYAVVKHPDDGYLDDLEASSTPLTTSEVDYDYGGATELWSGTWSADDVNATGFGFAFSFQCIQVISSSDPAVDAMWVKVYYTAAAVPVTTGKGFIIG